MVLGATDTTIEIDGQSYKKGSVRPAYSGGSVSFFFPWFDSTQTLFIGNYDQVVIDGDVAESIDQVKDYVNANFY
mgnify:CR=1 FL=1